MQSSALFLATMLVVGPQADPPSDGTLKPDNCIIDAMEKGELQVGSRVIGHLESLEVDVGHEVTAGMVIGKLDDRHAQVQVRSQQEKAKNDVNLRYAKAVLDVSNTTVARMEEANRRSPSANPELAILEKKLEAKRAELQIEQAEYQRTLDELELEEALLSVEDHLLVSPVTGIVTEVLRHPGEPVRQGDPVMRILRTDRFRVMGSLPARHAWTVRKGQKVDVRIRIGDGSLPVEREVFRGKVVALDPRISGGTFKVYAEIENRGGLLRPGLSAAMTIFLRDTSPGVAERQPAAAAN